VREKVRVIKESAAKKVMVSPASSEVIRRVVWTASPMKYLMVVKG
jgi:hypothetical protein